MVYRPEIGAFRQSNMVTSTEAERSHRVKDIRIRFLHVGRNDIAMIRVTDT